MCRSAQPFPVATDIGPSLVHRPISRPWSLQVLLDLGAALVLVLSWVIPVAKASGRNPWPWVVATPFLGSISPLLYLALSPVSRSD